MQRRAALVVGGSGCLGREVLKTLKLQSDWWVSSLAFESVDNINIDCNFVLSTRDDLNAQAQQAIGQIEEARAKLLQGEGQEGATGSGGKFLDTIVCVAGGWRGGSAASKHFIPNCDTVIKQSVWSSLLSANLAARFLKSGGLLVLTGALPAATGGTPGMIGYGMAKAAVHHLVQSLACPKSGLPPDSNVVAIVPSMIDTPANRKGASADVDTSDWTKMQEFCDVISRWACDSESRMTSGSLVKFETVDNKTSISCL